MFLGLKNYRDKQTKKINKKQNRKKAHNNAEVSRKRSLPKRQKKQEQ